MGGLVCVMDLATSVLGKADPKHDDVTTQTCTIATCILIDSYSRETGPSVPVRADRQPPIYAYPILFTTHSHQLSPKLYHSPAQQGQFTEVN